MKQVKKFTVIGFMLVSLIMILSFLMLNKVNSATPNTQPATTLVNPTVLNDTPNLNNHQQITNQNLDNYNSAYTLNSAVADKKDDNNKKADPKKEDIIVPLVLLIIFGTSITAVLVVVIVVKLLVL